MYDPTLSGHHPEYAAYIINRLTEAGNDVLYLTPDRSERVEMVEQAGAEIEYCGRVPPGLAKRHPQTFLNSRYAIKVATEWNADVFHHLFVDSREPAITTALSTTTIPTLFTLFNPHYDRIGGLIKKKICKIMPWFSGDVRNEKFLRRYICPHFSD